METLNPIEQPTWEQFWRENPDGPEYLLSDLREYDAVWQAIEERACSYASDDIDGPIAPRAGDYLRAARIEFGHEDEARWPAEIRTVLAECFGVWTVCEQSSASSAPIAKSRERFELADDLRSES